jgi:hypothetical protein
VQYNNKRQRSPLAHRSGRKHHSLSVAAEGFLERARIFLRFFCSYFAIHLPPRAVGVQSPVTPMGVDVVAIICSAGYGDNPERQLFSLALGRAV